jgi:hypothetical protein
MSEPQQETAKAGTRYVILVQTKDDENGWRQAGACIATSADAAVKQAATATSAAATYVAVPERSWKPVKVTVSQETRVTLG